ncbi:MAG: hypothetical protein ING56_14110 [Rhodocyclaceae bacterium]|nr:hypothetical protein [Rhodocyclaceae bacterium]MCA3025313.1 hypothetical protein [Rhodocyclaceae bacterium]MCA3033053.1 hypothetical protein [Rhodocyclaceae bacterium]MCA3037802.1 hypothetical protein [Rhodocyclaceae bacterium]MCA3063767.1 hypothetical protein [Rhodocyclaceae bacterium]
MSENARVFDANNPADFTDACKIAQRYMPKQQYQCVLMLLNGEEGGFFKEKLCEIATTITAMTRYGGESNRPIEPIAQLHYFGPGYDGYVCALSDEPDEDEEVLEAYGLARFDHFGDDGSIGYLSIAEYKTTRFMELDFHWQPKTFDEIRRDFHNA